MTNLPTSDIEGQVAQIRRAVEAGAEYIRITTPTLTDVEFLRQIKERINEHPEDFMVRDGSLPNSVVSDGVPASGSACAGMTTLRGGVVVPLVADVHFSPKVAIEAAKVASKVRINPGNFIKADKSVVIPAQAEPEAGTPSLTTNASERTSSLSTNASAGTPSLTTDPYLEQLQAIMRPLLDTCKEYGTVLRIGTNHGSLSERILDKYGDTPEGMVQATLEAVRICRAENFHDIVLSLKSSNVKIMVEATRLLVKRMDEENMDYPLHLGVTEAGEGEDGRLKSAIGIGSLLVDGIGDTIRVSLTEDPEFEIPVAFGILQASRARITRTEYISCPGCGRTTFKLQEAARNVKEATAHLTGLKIAVMGCIVNGPGEMADADFGYVGAGPGKVHIYAGKVAVLKNVAEEDAVAKLLEIIGSAAAH
jgi:(E)-4-hydroxy-3-methylbut-2-enyl-diphosphate synthase